MWKKYWKNVHEKEDSGFFKQVWRDLVEFSKKPRNWILSLNFCNFLDLIASSNKDFVKNCRKDSDLKCNWSQCFPGWLHPRSRSSRVRCLATSSLWWRRSRRGMSPPRWTTLPSRGSSTQLSRQQRTTTNIQTIFLPSSPLASPWCKKTVFKT